MNTVFVCTTNCRPHVFEIFGRHRKPHCGYCGQIQTKDNLDDGCYERPGEMNNYKDQLELIIQKYFSYTVERWHVEGVDKLTDLMREELDDLAQTFHHSKSYTGQQIHQVINARMKSDASRED